MDLQFQLDTLKSTRDNARKILESFSLDQINKIPKGFNNNLVWNYGHSVVTQQLLCYKLSGLPMHISKDLVKKYMKGSQPESEVDQAQLHELYDLDTKVVDHLEVDYNNKIFKEYKAYSTSYGITLSNIDQAISFNNVHEGHHLGNMLSIRKFI